MASKTISQRISLEGSDDIKKKLEELGKAGEKSFKQIADAAEKTKADPARFDQVKTSVEKLGVASTQLGNQFKGLAESVVNFGSKGVASFSEVAGAAGKTTAAAQDFGIAVGQSAQRIEASGQTASQKLVSTATAFKLAAIGIAGAITVLISALTKGAVETGVKIAEQAEKLKLSTKEWVALRQAIAGAGGSFDDFVKGAGKTVDLIQKMKDEIAKVSTTFKVMGVDGKSVEVTATRMNELTKESAAAAMAFRSLGVQMKTLQSGDTMAILRETATIINGMPDGLKKSAAGVQFFGDSWQAVIKTLLAARTATVDTAEAARLKSRELTADQIDTAGKVKKAWDDLGAAIRATKDQVGAFFLAGELKRVTWLRDMVDDTRLLLRQWLGLSDAQRALRLQDIGTGAAATAFKILIALGDQLAGIWNDVLVPAGEKVMAVVKQIAGNFGVTWEQVAAGLVTVAIAATAFAVAFKGIAFVLSPFTALIGLFASFGPILIPLIALVVLFWDQIKAGAGAVAALLPLSIEKLKQAFQSLLQGDFAKAWELFSAAAIEAFETIKFVVIQTFNDIRRTGEGVFADLIRLIAGDQIRSPWLAELVESIKQIGVELPATLALLAAAFVGLRKAGVALAPILSRIFGVEITGTGALVLGIVGQMSGAFSALAAVATVVGGVFTALVATVTLIGFAFGATAAAVAGFIALLPVLAVLVVVFWDTIKNMAVVAGNTIKNVIADVTALITAWVTTPIANAWQWLVAAFDAVVAQLVAAAESAGAKILKALVSPVSLAGDAARLGASLSGGKGNAAGGLLGGRGTGTSDSNLAWVSRGEHIMPARAVSQPGVLAFLEALRLSGGNLRAVLNSMGHFALGGMIRAPLSIPAFAGGGMHNVTIAFPGLPDITGLRASSGVVDQLRQAAAMAQVRSGGRKPSRYS